MLHDHYLAIKRWSLSYIPSDHCFGHTMVWIRLKGLNVLYYEESSIKTIVAGIGRPIKEDFAIKEME